MASKIVVLGAVNGRFREVFKKLAALHSKNAFAFAIVAGDLFVDPQTATQEDADDVEALINGAIQVPLSTYFALSNHALPENIIQRLDSSSGEVCENLFFLGKRTTFKTSEGIRIVALGGNLDSNTTAGVSKDKYLPFFTEDDAKALKGAHTTDILVTNLWPANVRTGSNKEFDSSAEPPSNQSIADLCTSLKPRYHFSVSPQNFYEREPFLHQKEEPASDESPVTRFISLAQYNNAHKQKWIYAFTLSPPSTSTPIPPGTTPSPLTTTTKKRALPSQQSYRFSSTNESHPRKRNRRGQQPPSRSECFFCLSSPTAATHLLTSIGTDAYLTTAKGPLPLSSTYPTLSFPAHILIIALAHAPTLSTIQPPESRTVTYAEMTRYRRALDAMLAKTANGALGSVAWEVARQGGVHTHWQWVPLPVDLVRRGLAALAFEVEAENDKYPSFVKKDAGDGEAVGGDYFRVVVWGPGSEEEGDKGKEEAMYLPLDDSFRFDLQFGRRVVAKLLGLEKRVQWQECGQTEAEETADAEAFKGAFKEFDFSLEE